MMVMMVLPARKNLNSQWASDACPGRVPKPVEGTCKKRRKFRLSSLGFMGSAGRLLAFRRGLRFRSLRFKNSVFRGFCDLLCIRVLGLGFSGLRLERFTKPETGEERFRV